MINPAKNFKIPRTSKIEIRIIKLSKAIKVFTSMSEVLTVPKLNESKAKIAVNKKVLSVKIRLII